MRWPGANLEEKHEPRGVSVAEAQNGDSMKSSGRNLTLAAIEKHEPRGVSVAEAQNGDSMKSSGRNLTLAAIEKTFPRGASGCFLQTVSERRAGAHSSSSSSALASFRSAVSKPSVNQP